METVKKCIKLWHHFFLKIIFTIGISLIIIFFLGLLFGGFRHANLKFYNVPLEIYIQGSSDGLDVPEGHVRKVRRQFITCLPKMFCSFKRTRKGNLIIYRNNNNFWDKRFGNIEAVNETTYTINTINENTSTIIIEIPKKWVFGKD